MSSPGLQSRSGERGWLPVSVSAWGQQLSSLQGEVFSRHGQRHEL